MTSLAATLRQARKELGYSQVRLAALSGVSLPTIQNIEAGKANPSLEIIEKLSECVGVSLEVRFIPANWDILIAHGVPLITSETIDTKPQMETLIKQIQFAARELTFREHKEISDYARKVNALQATLWALESYFPSVFKNHLSHSATIQKWVSQERTGEMIKLRRIAVENLSRYL